MQVLSGRLIDSYLCCLLLAAAVGCESSTPPKQGGPTLDAGATSGDATPTEANPLCVSSSGSRLSREVIAVSATARQEYDLIDTQNDTPCRFIPEADGSYTCYPLNTGGSVFYQDGNCTFALASFALEATPALFTKVLRGTNDPCNPSVAEYRRVGMTSGVSAGQNVFRRVMGACETVVAPTRNYFVASGVLPATEFVTASAELFSADTRLSTRVYAGSDGSRMCAHQLPIVDSTLATNCAFYADQVGQTRCIPIGTAGLAGFLDAACTTEVPIVEQRSCQVTKPQYTTDFEIAKCGGGLVIESVAQVGDEVSMRYQDVGGQCVAAPSDTSTYYGLGASIELSEFQSVSTQVALGSDRLQARLVRADGFAVFAGSWMDTKLGVECVFQTANDGSFRCLPLGMIKKRFYTDANCMMDINLALENPCQAGGFFTRSGPVGVRVFAGQQYSAPLYDLVETGCELVTGEGPIFEETYEHDASSFQIGDTTLL